MGQPATLNILILREDEIRLAAKAVHAAVTYLNATADAPTMATRKAARDLVATAINACAVALAGAERDGAAILLSDSEFFRRAATPTPESPR